MPHAAVQITLPKGSYVPVFVEHAVTQPSDVASIGGSGDVLAGGVEQVTVAEPSVRPTLVSRAMILAFAAGFALCALGVAAWRLTSAVPNRLPPVLMESTWGPLVQHADQCADLRGERHEHGGAPRAVQRGEQQASISGAQGTLLIVPATPSAIGGCGTQDASRGQ